MTQMPRSVGGEPADLLLSALSDIRGGMSPADQSGMVRINAKIGGETGAALIRALMRTEAEFLLDDANRVDASLREPRTPDQRRADALMALARRLSEAHDGGT